VDVDLDVATGEVLAVMGPSGSGKSTVLRLVAGLDRPQRGTVAWDGVDITATPPHLRRFGLMFQDYALFPHRTVAENVAFGLRMQGWEPGVAGARVDEVLDLVGLGGFGDRRVPGLSGGEQQRVALARTLAPSPRMIMLDEPLGSLDRELRDRLATETRALFTALGVTAIYVTHDHEEAFAMADRVGILRAGRVEAQGTPQELWEDPGTEFVARLLGHPNVVDAAPLAAGGLLPQGLAGTVLVPVAAVTIEPSPDGSADVVASTYRGGHWETTVTMGSAALVGITAAPIPVGTRVEARVDAASVVRLRG
jgi:thiamine transport system ATP-binding protein